MRLVTTSDRLLQLAVLRLDDVISRCPYRWPEPTEPETDALATLAVPS